MNREIVLRYVVYVEGTKSVFGPFSSEGHAKLWACTGCKGLEYQVLRYIGLLEEHKKYTFEDYGKKIGDIKNG